MLAAFSEIEIEARSKIYETQSVEGGGPDNFLNAVLRVSTPITPRELLEVQAGMYGVPKAERRTMEILEAVGLAEPAIINRPSPQAVRRCAAWVLCSLRCLSQLRLRLLPHSPPTQCRHPNRGDVAP